MLELKEIWNKKGFSFRIRKDGFVAKRMNEMLKGKKCEWNKKYYFVEDGMIFDKATKKIVDIKG